MDAHERSDCIFTEVEEIVMNEQIKKLQNDIERLYEEISRLQSQCPHLNAKKIPKSDADDWDAPGKGVHYWYECKCQDCNKYWEEPQ